MALAEHEAKSSNAPQEMKTLKAKHLTEVIEMSQIFKKYLSDFKGDEAYRAASDSSRMDRDKIPVLARKGASLEGSREALAQHKQSV